MEIKEVMKLVAAKRATSYKDIVRSNKVYSDLIASNRVLAKKQVALKKEIATLKGRLLIANTTLFFVGSILIYLIITM